MADFDGDGERDLAIVDWDFAGFDWGPFSAGVFDFCADAQARIDLPRNAFDVYGAWVADAATSGDFDGDGYIDLAAIISLDRLDYEDVVYQAWAGPFVRDRAVDDTLFHYMRPPLVDETNYRGEFYLVGWHAVGDLDDDGNEDLLLEWGSPRQGTGHIGVSYGPLQGELDYDAQRWVNDQTFGTWIHTLDDLDGDGDDDLVVGVLDSQPLGPLTAVFLGPLHF